MFDKCDDDDFKIVKDVKDGTLSLMVSGCADALSMDCYAHIKEMMIDNQVNSVVVDVSGIKSMDSSMIGLMVALHSFAKKNSIEVKYVKLNSFFKRMIEITSLDTILTIE